VLRFLLLAFATTLLLSTAYAQGNTKEVYQRDTGPAFGKKLPELNPKDVPTRELAGIVRDENDDPVEGAIVHLRNVKTKAGRSFVTKKDGRYKFDQLIKSEDYEVYANRQGRATETKSLSTYDPREKPTLNLRFEKQKSQAKAEQSAKPASN